MVGPLSGIVVLDLTQQLVGPGATMLLGDMGADVIHVELPPQVDYPGIPVDSVGRMRAFMNQHRSKRSISLDLTKEEARAIVYEIAAKADVLCQNFRPGVAERLGMDYERIKEFNPSIVYCGVNAFGQTGSERDRVGFDIIAQAAGGSMMPGYADPSLPSPVGVPIGDVTGFCLAALGMVAALYHRKETGEGQQVTTSLLHAVVLNNILSLFSNEDEDRVPRQALVDGATEMARNGASYAQITETIASARGAAAAWTPMSVYYRTYRTSDGFIALGALNARQQVRVNAALDLADPRFESGVDIESPEALKTFSVMQARAEEIFAAKTTEEWIEFLDARSIACGPVLNVLEVLDHPHHFENEIIIAYDDPWVGPVRALGYPIQFEKTPMQMQKPAPPIGHETDEILSWLGRSPEEIERLRELQVAF